MCGCLWPPTQAYALTGDRTSDPFGLQAGTQSTEPLQLGLTQVLLNQLCDVFVSQAIRIGFAVHFGEQINLFLYLTVVKSCDF